MTKDDLQSVLNRYSGQSLEFALQFEIEGLTLLGHLEKLMDKTYKEGKRDGGKNVLERVRLYSDINSAKGRQGFRKNIDDLQTMLDEVI